MKKTLEEYVESKISSGASKAKALKQVYDEAQNWKIRLKDPNPPKHLIEYLARPEYSAWLWTTLSISVVTIALTAISSHLEILTYLRYLLGSVFTLFIPGYATVEALYPKERELSQLERLALSIGLSIAIVPLLALILNYTPWGIRQKSVAALLTLYISIIGLTAAWRKAHQLQKRT